MVTDLRLPLPSPDLVDSTNSSVLYEFRKETLASNCGVPVSNRGCLVGFNGYLCDGTESVSWLQSEGLWKLIKKFFQMLENGFVMVFQH